MLNNFPDPSPKAVLDCVIAIVAGLLFAASTPLRAFEFATEGGAFIYFQF